MNRFIISDTSCLIALDRINKLELLGQVFTNIITTKEVQEEFGRALPSWIVVHEVKDKSRKNSLSELVDKGEASAIALALEIENSVLIIDEKKGRKLAAELRLEIIGTLRILLLAKQKGIIPNVTSLIHDLEKMNFRFSQTLVQEIVSLAGEA
jgi:uncharacterized protein